MPEVEHTTVIATPAREVWDFVEDIDNWAELVTGYQSHTVIDRDHSVWTLKGDVGVLARVVEIAVEVTEWREPERVDFVITGVTERVSGGGSFVLADRTPAPTQADVGSAVEPVRPGPVARLIRRILRALLRLVSRSSAAPEAPTPAPGDASGGSALTFRLELSAGGPMAPMVNALLAPMLGPAAEEFSRNLAHRLRQDLDAP